MPDDTATKNGEPTKGPSFPARIALTALGAAALGVLVWPGLRAPLPASPAEGAPAGRASASGSSASGSSASGSSARRGATSPAEGAPIEPEITTIEGEIGYRLLTFTIPLEGARLRVLDLAMGRDLAAARATASASLVVNGGFFDPRNQPEGLVVSEGEVLSPKSDSLGGGVLTITSGEGRLAATEAFSLLPGTMFAIQARPRLVVGSAAHVKKDDGRGAERTALCLRSKGRVLEVLVARGEQAGKGPTLSLFADMLESRGCEEALNLDGGPSTGVAWRGADREQVLLPRAGVRQGVAIWVSRDPEVE